MLKNIIHSKYNPFIISFLFLYLYIPPLFNISIMHILTLISVSIIFFIYKNYIDIFYLLKNSKLIFFNVISFLALVLLMSFSIYTGFSIKTIYSVALPFTEVYFCGLFIVIYFYRLKYSMIEFINVIFIVASIQSLIVLLAFFLPGARSFFIEIYLHHGYPASYQTMPWRLFGFANSLTYGMAIVQAVLACIGLYLAINCCWRYILVVPLFLFTSIVNARTGIVIFISGLILIMVYSFTQNNKRRNILLVSCILGLFLVSAIGLIIISQLSPSTGKWILSFFTQTIEFAKGNNTEFFADVFDKGQFILPKGTAFIFGVGHSIMGLDGISSDIGYINDIWIGGIIYAIIAWAAFAWIFAVSFQKRRDIFGFLTLLCVLTFLFSNLKGMLITQNEIISLIYILILFVTINKDNWSVEGAPKDN